MANNLYSKLNRHLVIYDTGSTSVSRFMEGKDKSRVTIASNPGQVASLSSVVVTMLPASDSVKKVYFGDQGLAQNTKKGKLFIDSSTIDPMVSKEVGLKLKELDCIAVDAPVSGGKLIFYVNLK